MGLKTQVNHGTLQPSSPKTSGRAGAALQAVMGKNGSASLQQLVWVLRAWQSCLCAFLPLPGSFATRHPIITHSGLRSPAQQPSLFSCHQLIPKDNVCVAVPSCIWLGSHREAPGSGPGFCASNPLPTQCSEALRLGPREAAGPPEGQGPGTSSLP